MLFALSDNGKIYHFADDLAAVQASVAEGTPIESLPAAPNDKDSFRGFAVRTCVPGTSPAFTRVYASTLSGYVYKLYQNKWRRIGRSTNPNYLPGMAIDPVGNLWCCGNDGLFFYDGISAMVSVAGGYETNFQLQYLSTYLFFADDNAVNPSLVVLDTKTMTSFGIPSESFELFGDAGAFVGSLMPGLIPLGMHVEGCESNVESGKLWLALGTKADVPPQTGNYHPYVISVNVLDVIKWYMTKNIPFIPARVECVAKSAGLPAGPVELPGDANQLRGVTRLRDHLIVSQYGQGIFDSVSGVTLGLADFDAANAVNDVQWADDSAPFA